MIEFDAYNKIENDLHVELFVYSTTTVVVASWWNFEANKNHSSILSSVFIDVLKFSPILSIFKTAKFGTCVL